MGPGQQPARHRDKAGILMMYWEHTPGRPPYLDFLKQAWPIFQPLKPFPSSTLLLGEVKAEVNHGRWIVRCPRCPAALEVCRAMPVFLCVECGHGWLQVKFPKGRPTIEALLLARPKPQNRNWRPGEAVGALDAENAELLGERR